MAREVAFAGRAIGIGFILILIALIIFVLVFFGVTFEGVSATELLALGLAFFAAGHLVG